MEPPGPVPLFAQADQIRRSQRLEVAVEQRAGIQWEMADGDLTVSLMLLQVLQAVEQLAEDAQMDDETGRRQALHARHLKELQMTVPTREGGHRSTADRECSGVRRHGPRILQIVPHQ